MIAAYGSASTTEPTSRTISLYPQYDRSSKSPYKSGRQRHDLVKILGVRPFKYEGQQNIDILNEGFKMPELTENKSDEDAKDDIAADGGADGDDGKKVDDVPAGAIPVAS